jgi:hypothetical protein
LTVRIRGHHHFLTPFKQRRAIRPAARENHVKDMLRLRRACAAAMIATLAPLCACAAPVDFEGFLDGESLTGQISGLTFTNATVLQAGVSLNDANFPPHSGINVVVDAGGPMSILFNNSISSFSAFFTYVSQLTMRAYDANGAVVDTATSLFNVNYAGSGTPGSSPNEAIAVDFASGIRRIEILGDIGGDSFVMDDASYVPTSTSEVPEPASMLLAATALTLLAGMRHPSRGRHRIPTLEPDDEPCPSTTRVRRIHAARRRTRPRRFGDRPDQRVHQHLRGRCHAADRRHLDDQ